jgi:hypothetical protein
VHQQSGGQWAESASQRVESARERHWTLVVDLHGLAPNTTYDYQVLFFKSDSGTQFLMHVAAECVLACRMIADSPSLSLSARRRSISCIHVRSAPAAHLSASGRGRTLLLYLRIMHRDGLALAL